MSPPSAPDKALSRPLGQLRDCHRLDEADGRPFVLRLGLTFTDEAVDNGAGRAVDGDTVWLLVHDMTRSLSAEPWTAAVRFSPLIGASDPPTSTTPSSPNSNRCRMSYVEIVDATAGLTVRYQP